MNESSPKIITPDELSDLVRAVRARTPARVLAGRAGPSYRTATQLDLRLDHAAAVDAVHAEIDLERDFGRAFLDRWDLFAIATRASTKAEYLMRPDLGRCLQTEAADMLARRRPPGADLQVIIGDGLSAAAVVAQVPELLPRLERETRDRDRQFGMPFFVRHCRVGVLNDVGEVLRPNVAVLLIGERPGLATAESLSAYLAYQPRTGHTDAQRNLISNIHARGIPPDAAAHRIILLAEQLIRLRTSGVAVKEERPGTEAERFAKDPPSARPHISGP